MFQVDLPFPPSVNSAYANNKHGKGRGRYRTETYNIWANAAGWDINRQHPKPISGPVNVIINLDASRRKFKNGNHRKIDLDNHAKAVCDLLVDHGLIEDDRKIETIFLAWANVVGCRVHVRKAISAVGLTEQAA